MSESVPQYPMDLTDDETTAVEALIEHARDEVTGGMEDADELIDVDADARSLLTGGITFRDREAFRNVVRGAGITDAEAAIESMEEKGIFTIEEAVYDRDHDGKGRKRAVVTVDEDALDAVMTG